MSNVHLYSVGQDEGCVGRAQAAIHCCVRQNMPVLVHKSRYRLNTAARGPDQGIFAWVKMSDFNTSEETGKASPVNLRPYVTKSDSAFSAEKMKFSNRRKFAEKSFISLL